MLQLAKMEGKRHLSPLTSDIELQDLDFALLGFVFFLVKYFLTMLQFLPFEMKYIFFVIVCWKSVVCFFDFAGVYS